MLWLTFIRHKWAGFEVQPLAGARADLLDVVAENVTSIFAAIQTDTFAKCCVVSAPVSCDLFVSVQERVNEKVHGSLVGTFQRLLEGCKTDRNKPRIRNHSYLQMLLVYLRHRIFLTYSAGTDGTSIWKMQQQLFLHRFLHYNCLILDFIYSLPDHDSMSITWLFIAFLFDYIC